MSETVQPFEAEVGRILDLVIHSLYKDRDIFLRELVSNASDACDKLRYQSLSQPELLEGESGFAITIRLDEAQGVLEIADNGIGMDRGDLVENLGTIARSGTARFLDAITGDNGQDMKLIGQFGVGFYSVFMVADKVIVRSRKAGDENVWLWASDGKSGFSVSEGETGAPRGTSIRLHLKEDAKEFLEEHRIRSIVRHYSDHIAFPIMLEVEGEEKAGDEESRTDQKAPEQINDGSALWARNRSEITEEQYREFYHHTAHAFDEPFARLTVRQIKDKLDAGWAPYVLDVRKPTEYITQHVVGARNFPLDYINKNMARIQRNNTYYLHCLGGFRSMITASILKSRGFNNVIDVQGGWRAIEESSAPLSEYACPTTIPQEVIDQAIEAVA